MRRNGEGGRSVATVLYPVGFKERQPRRLVARVQEDSLSGRRDERRRLIYGVSMAFIYAVKDSRVPREIDLIYATPFLATD